MDVSYTKKGDLIVVHFSGFFEYYDEGKLVSFVQARVAEKPRIIAMDLTRVDTINSSGIATMLTILKMVDESRIDFLFYGMNQKVLLLLEKVFSNDFVPLLTEEEFKEKYL